MGNILPDGDLLIHSGDISSVGGKGEVIDFFEWCVKTAPKFTHGIVFIAGNHDRSFDPKFGEYEYFDEVGQGPKVKPSWLRSILFSDQLSSNNVHYLENSEITIDGLKIWGSPITPWFHGDRWAFNQFRGPEIKATWDTIPMDTDILVTHGPVANKLDLTVYRKEYVGCEDLRKAVDRVRPIVHVFGHIHEGYGVDQNLDTTFFNASTCNLGYDPYNKPWEVILEGKEVISYQ
jgi:Icc-related predicted phosphoesterase